MKRIEIQSLNMTQNLLYKNVTISGLPGAGSSTLGKAVCEKLGWEYFSGGDFMRMYAVKNGLFDKNNHVHHDATAYSDDFDRKVDFQMRDMLKDKENKVVEAWLSGFMAQGVPGTLKVLVVCSDDAIRVDRIVNRDNIGIEEAKQHIFEREQRNLEKWRRLYSQEWHDWVVKAGKSAEDKPIYFWYPQLYDLVLDTFSLSKDQTLQNVLEKLGYIG